MHVILASSQATLDRLLGALTALATMKGLVLAALPADVRQDLETKRGQRHRFFFASPDLEDAVLRQALACQGLLDAFDLAIDDRSFRQANLLAMRLRAAQGLGQYVLSAADIDVLRLIEAALGADPEQVARRIANS